MDINNLPEIGLIDSVDPGCAISLAVIEVILANNKAAVSHGDQFTGKPGTQIYADEHFVVKVYAGLSFKEKDAVRWVTRSWKKKGNTVTMCLLKHGFY